MLPACVGQVIKGWDVGVNGITFLLLSNTRLLCGPYFHAFGLVLVNRYAGWWQKEAHHSTFNGVRYPSHWFVSPAVARSNPVLICSSFCRYGSDRVGKIPQNSTLIFDVELVNVKWSWGPRWHEGFWSTVFLLQCYFVAVGTCSVNSMPSFLLTSYCKQERSKANCRVTTFGLLALDHTAVDSFWSRFDWVIYPTISYETYWNELINSIGVYVAALLECQLTLLLPGQRQRPSERCHWLE